MTPFRAVTTIQLAIMRETRGAMDLFVTEEANLRNLLVADAADVSIAVVHTLRDAGVRQPHPVPRGIAAEPMLSWLSGAATNHRRFVWLTVGMVKAAFEVSAADALALFRASCYGRAKILDDVARALVTGSLHPGQLGAG